MSEGAVKASGRAGLGGILAANGVTVLIALVQDWPLALMLWPFWIQSVIIGWFSRKRILALKEFSVEGFKVNGRQAEATPQTQRETANFLVLHYGAFHAGYLVFLMAKSPAISGLDWLLIGASGVGFWLGHQRSHRLNVDADTRTKRNIGALMFLPYVRIVPMHLVILSGGTGGSSAVVMLLFGGLKTAADAFMHVVEHRWLQGRRPAPAPTDAP